MLRLVTGLIERLTQLPASHRAFSAALLQELQDEVGRLQESWAALQEAERSPEP